MPCVVKYFTGFDGGYYGVAGPNMYVEGLYYAYGAAELTTVHRYSWPYSFWVCPTGSNLGFGVVSPPGGSGWLNGNFNTNEIFGCFRFRVSAFPEVNYSHIIRVSNTGTQGMSVCVSTSGYLQVRDGLENLLGSAVYPIVGGQWYVLEFKQRRSDQTYELKVDGSSVISGVNALGWPLAIVDSVYVGKSQNIGGAVSFRYDDLVLCTGDYLPQPYTINTGGSSREGYYLEWYSYTTASLPCPYDYSERDFMTAQPGELWYLQNQSLSRYSDGDSAFRSNMSTNQIDTTCRGVPSSSGEILAVVASFSARRGVQNAAAKVRTIMRSNGTDKLSTVDNSMQPGYGTVLCQMEATDFGRGGVPWTNATVGLLDWGLKCVAGFSPPGPPYCPAGKVHWTSGVLSVLYSPGYPSKTKVYYDLGG